MVMYWLNKNRTILLIVEVCRSKKIDEIINIHEIQGDIKIYQEKQIAPKPF